MNIPEYFLDQNVSPEKTVFLQETNPYHLDCIGETKWDNNEKFTFCIVIENWDTGEYRFMNSIKTDGSISNTHFPPYKQKPLKTIRDLNNVWKAITGDNLTYIGR